MHLALARSKSTWSFATTPGNRFVMPLSSRRGASAMGEGLRAGLGPPLVEVDYSKVAGGSISPLISCSVAVATAS